MKSYHRHKDRLRHRILRKFKQQFKFFLYLAALVLIMIGNNFASFRGDDQQGRGSYVGGNHSSENNKGLQDIQNGIAQIHHNIPLDPTLGVGRGRQIESMIEYAWGSIWSHGGQWDKFYIQSAMNPQNAGLKDWEDYVLASLGSSQGNHQGFGHHLSDERSGSFLNLANQDGGGANPTAPFVGSPLEYPHSTNYGRGYNADSGGGSSGLSGLGGSGGGGSNPPKANDDPVQIPEPSTLILTAIGLLLVTQRPFYNSDAIHKA